MRESAGKPATNSPAPSTSGGRKEKTAIDKIQQTRQRKVQLLVDGGGNTCYSLSLTNTNGAPNVIRTVINLGNRFRAEPCQKPERSVKGSPQTPLPKTHILKVFRGYVSVSVPHLTVWDTRLVWNDLVTSNYLPLFLPNNETSPGLTVRNSICKRARLSVNCDGGGRRGSHV